MLEDYCYESSSFCFFSSVGFRFPSWMFFFFKFVRRIINLLFQHCFDPSKSEGFSTSKIWLIIKKCYFPIIFS